VSSILPFPFVFALEHLAGQKFHKDKEIKNEVTTWLRVPAAEFCDIGILRLISRLKKCLEKYGDYVEKQLKVHVKSVFTPFFNKYFKKIVMSLYLYSLVIICITTCDCNSPLLHLLHYSQCKIQY